MKILIVRFSSIGDIVLTTPVIRALKEADDSHEIHYLTKKSFSSIIEDNPFVDKLHLIEKSIDELIEPLKVEKFDLIVDLHNNLRTRSLKSKLRRPSRTFKKLNVQKWLLVNFKIDRLPKVHIVDRYLDTVRDMISSIPEKGDFYIRPENEQELSNYNLTESNFLCVAVGAKFATKQIPENKLKEILHNMDLPIVLIGGKEDHSKGEEIRSNLDSNVINLCGELNLQQSASIVARSKALLTSDTGMMHIAACYDVPILSVWGNTVPELGMYPYRPQQKDSYTIFEVKGLKCRPCSKIGFESCPKKHFNCMNLQDSSKIREKLIED